MSQVKGKNTKPEMLVRKYLFSQGFRYRLHDKRLSGSPDIVLPRYKVAIFVHGCFWHRHQGCSKATTPKSNCDFWNDKFDKNIGRDSKKEMELAEAGWRPIVIWECQLGKAARDRTLSELAEYLRVPGSKDL